MMAVIETLSKVELPDVVSSFLKVAVYDTRRGCLSLRAAMASRLPSVYPFQGIRIIEVLSGHTLWSCFLFNSENSIC